MNVPEIGQQLRKAQLDWATRAGHVFDERGYVADLALNLHTPLHPDTMAEFGRASGGELKDGTRGPAKMKALHSSSALACNFFDYWRGRDPACLGRVLGLEEPVAALAFEAQCPTGLEGTPPNLDLLLTLRSGTSVGVESKFTELYGSKAKGSPFKLKYFPSNRALWGERGLQACQHLAETIHRDPMAFRILNAAQLLKHVLGLACRFGGRPALLYIYYGTIGEPGELHSAELSQFAARVRDDIQFYRLSYQEAFVALPAPTAPDERAHRRYLVDRYFRVAPN